MIAASGTSRRGAGRKARRYDATGRQAEARRTTERIIDAATDLVKAGVRPEEISYADLAARTRLATRTVYRHFPELHDLTTAIAAATMARVTGGDLPENRPAIASTLASLHEILCADPKLFRVFMDTPLRARMDYGRFLERVFADVLERIPARHRAAAGAVIEALANPPAWHVMHVYWGVPREQVTRACLAAIQAVVDRFQREPELLDPTGPLPPLFRDAATRKEVRHARRRTH
jgi:AcrR family transcriptional regulator